MVFVKCTGCNQEKEIRSNGLCSSCYYKEYRRNKASKGKCIECGEYKISNKSKYYCGKCLARKKYDQQRYRLFKDVGIN